MVLVQFLPPAVSDAHFVAWKAPRQRRAVLAACCMAARRIVGRPGRRWRTSQRAQHEPGVRKLRRACPAAGKSPLVWAPGLLWWAAAPTGLWAHHDGRVSEGGRPADPSADRSIAFKRWPPGPLFGVDVKNNLSQLKGFAGNYPAKTSIPTGYTPQTGRGLEKRPPNPPLKMCNRCLATPTIVFHKAKVPITVTRVLMKVLS